MPGVTFEDFGKDLDSIPDVIGSDSPAKPKAAPKKKPANKKPANKKPPTNKPDMSTKLTIRFTDQQLASIKDQLARSATLSTELRLIILDHFDISE